MKIHKSILIVLILELSSCALNSGFPKEVTGSLKPINSEEIKNNVK